MIKRLSIFAVALVATVSTALPMAASAHGWGDHGGWGGRGGYHGGYGGHDYYRGGYGHGGGHWSGGRWIAGAIVTGLVAGVVVDALRPAPVYYDQPAVVYSQPTRVIYENDPVVTRRVVYEDTYQTRYIRDDTRYVRDDDRYGD